MKKKLLTILLSVAMIVMMLPTMAFADSAVVTTTGGDVTAPLDAPTVAGGLLVQANAANKKITYTWNAFEGATAYKLYQAQANQKKYKLVATTDKTTFAKKGLKKGVIYKAYVEACDADGAVIFKSADAYAITKGGKFANAKKVAAASSISVMTGKTAKLNAKIAAKDSSKAVIKSVKQLKFICSDEEIATVSAKGVVKGVKAGTCYVLTLAANGKYALTKVIVADPATVTFALSLSGKTLEIPKEVTLDYATWGDAAKAGAKLTISGTQEELQKVVADAKAANVSLGQLSQYEMFLSYVSGIEITFAVKSDKSGNVTIAIDSCKVNIGSKTQGISLKDASFQLLYAADAPVVTSGTYNTIENGHQYLLAK